MAETARKAEEIATDAPVEARLAGHLDQIEGGFVRGWAHDEAAPGRRVVVDVYLADRLLGAATADRYREDLATAGIGDGRHAFVFTLPPAARTVPPRAIGVCFQGTRQPLVRSDGGTPAEPVAVPVAAPAEDALRVAGRLEALERAVANLRAGLDGLDTELRGARARLEQAGRDHDQVLAAIAALERHLGGHRVSGLGERIAALDAAISVLRDDATDARIRFQASDKAIADIDAFLFRFDERLRAIGAGPKQRRGVGLVAALAIAALLVAIGALAIALWPDAAALIGAPFGV